MPGLYAPFKTYTAGEVLTAADLNATDVNHIMNQTLQMTDDYAVDTPQFQSVADPGEVGTESRPTSAAGELERIRFVVREMKGQAQWYESHFKRVALLTGPAPVNPPAGQVDLYAIDDAGVSRLAYRDSAGTETILRAALPVVYGIHIIDADQSTTSTTYTNLPTFGPQVALSPGRTTDQLIMLRIVTGHANAGFTTYGAVSVSGGPPSDHGAVRSELQSRNNFGTFILGWAVASGAAHTAKYRTTGGTAFYAQRVMFVKTLN